MLLKTDAALEAIRKPEVSFNLIVKTKRVSCSAQYPAVVTFLSLDFVA